MVREGGEWSNGFGDGDVWGLDVGSVKRTERMGMGGLIKRSVREDLDVVYLMMKTRWRVVVQLLVLLKIWISFCVVLMKLASKVSLVMFERMLV